MKAKLNLYRKFVEGELIPLEPLLLNHHYDELYNKLEEKRKEVKKRKSRLKLSQFPCLNRKSGPK